MFTSKLQSSNGIPPSTQPWAPVLCVCVGGGGVYEYFVWSSCFCDACTVGATFTGMMYRWLRVHAWDWKCWAELRLLLSKPVVDSNKFQILATLSLVWRRFRLISLISEMVNFVIFVSLTVIVIDTNSVQLKAQLPFRLMKTDNQIKTRCIC